MSGRAFATPERGDVSELLDRLRGVVGAANLLAGGDLGTWEVDWRKRWRGRALAVARPGSTAEVAQVVRLCAEHGTRHRSPGRQHRPGRRLGAR